MYSFRLLSAVVVCIGIIGGCGDDNPTSSQNSLVGTWELVSLNGNAVDPQTDVQSRLTFNANGTWTEVRTAPNGSTTTFSGTYTESGNTIVLHEENDPPGELETFTITISGSTLTVSQEGGDVGVYNRVS